ncbi:MAG: hypothetical protein ACRDPG_00450 [Nocardioidaceae bacterium]
MTRVLVWIALVLGSVAVFGALGLVAFGPPRWRLLRRRQRPTVHTRSLSELVQELRRLEAELKRAEGYRKPLRGRRIGSLTLEYDQTLQECCTSLGLTSPQSAPLNQLDRINTEADLCLHGVTW